MLYIKSPSTDPTFNIAAEEYLLKIFSDDIFFLYRNESSVIIGKHQNTLEEVNIDFVNRNGIRVVRRLSGGGTVYHDLGNVNFSLIINGIEHRLVDFRRYTLPVIAALQSLGVDARFEGRNDIRVNGKKISGNAEHLYRNRVLHHGTLLYSSNLFNLNEAIRVKHQGYQSKAVKSVRSTVANISDFCTDPPSIGEFINIVFDNVRTAYAGGVEYLFTNKDMDAIGSLVESKYSQWSWTYGYSPSYHLTRDFTVNHSTYRFNLLIDKGVIIKIGIENDELTLTRVSEIEKMLTGIPHIPETVTKALKGVIVEEHLPGLTADILSGLLF